MLLIDKYAYTNRLKDLNPMTKFIFSLSILIFSLSNKNIFVFGGILIFLSLLTMYVVRISLKKYLKLLSIPFIFLMVSIITMIFSIGTTKDVFLFHLKLGSYYVGITKLGMEQGMLLFCRALSSLASTYFFALTIPMNQLIQVFKTLRLSKTFIEIMILIYRFIFIFLEESRELYVAQDLRFGYKGLRNSYKSTALLIRILFIRVMSRYEELNISLETKLYNGEFYI
ncbi:cobalt ECF transporter T component CbiQ [Hathewaya limosa]|uniref:Cobalt/nickel transport system permease protein n=1 Tax=Hathewaya limosa TaxID=1536 RepID=A0ABU0JV37_HATLI|nr:cobalt ECF transporter T component CbiQ [Hathewaya limosa]MDQ0480975.1 cobalt/nickel transport system permease protein [Hathewaya limosa]